MRKSTFSPLWRRCIFGNCLDFFCFCFELVDRILSVCLENENSALICGCYTLSLHSLLWLLALITPHTHTLELIWTWIPWLESSRSSLASTESLNSRMSSLSYFRLLANQLMADNTPGRGALSISNVSAPYALQDASKWPYIRSWMKIWCLASHLEDINYLHAPTTPYFQPDRSKAKCTRGGFSGGQTLNVMRHDDTAMKQIKKILHVRSVFLFCRWFFGTHRYWLIIKIDIYTIISTRNPPPPLALITDQQTRIKSLRPQSQNAHSTSRCAQTDVVRKSRFERGRYGSPPPWVLFAADARTGSRLWSVICHLNYSSSYMRMRL